MALKLSNLDVLHAEPSLSFTKFFFYVLALYQLRFGEEKIEWHQTLLKWNTFLLLLEAYQKKQVLCKRYAANVQNAGTWMR